MFLLCLRPEDRRLQVQHQAPARVARLDGLMLVGDVDLYDIDGVLSALGPPAREPEPSPQQLLLLAYKRWGTGLLDRIQGDFSFALWDSARSLLFGARDHFGIRPLFHTRDEDGQLLVSDSVRALRDRTELRQLERAVVLDHLLFGWNTHKQSTIFAGLAKVPAGCYQQLEPPLSPRRYWRPEEPPEPIRHRRATDYVDHFRDTLKAAVKDRLPVRGAAFELSGGLDSSGLVAAAHDLPGFTSSLAYTRCFTGLVDSPEGDLAALTCARLGLRHQLHEALADLRPPEPAAPYPYESELAGVEAAAKEKISRHQSVLFSGLGGDPLLACAVSTPAEVWSGLGWRGVIRALRHHFQVYGLSLPRGLRWSEPLKSWQRSAPAPRNAPAWLRLPEARARLEEERQATGAFSLREGMAHHPIWEHNFYRAHQDVTGRALKVVYPYFDLRLYRLMQSIPQLTWTQDKAILRLACRDILPERIVLRRKTLLQTDGSLFSRWLESGGAAPDLSALRESSFLQYVESTVLEETLGSPGITSLTDYRLAACALALARWIRYHRL